MGVEPRDRHGKTVFASLSLISSALKQLVRPASRQLPSTGRLARGWQPVFLRRGIHREHAGLAVLRLPGRPGILQLHAAVAGILGVQPAHCDDDDRDSEGSRLTKHLIADRVGEGLGVGGSPDGYARGDR